TGSVSSLNGFTGSLQGTASWATNARTASFLPAGTYNITVQEALFLKRMFIAFPFGGDGWLHELAMKNYDRKQTTKLNNS
ncbi:MAG: hypothetical protein EBX05_10420, partial [Rhodobacteraceae bacterium]|nr:hypothetical protein [Paracoccaceae bacterium]